VRGTVFENNTERAHKFKKTAGKRERKGGTEKKSRGGGQKEQSTRRGKRGPPRQGVNKVNREGRLRNTSQKKGRAKSQHGQAKKKAATEKGTSNHHKDGSGNGKLTETPRKTEKRRDGEGHKGR